ncbi:MAG: alternate-type signal peptide domain-containing protein [Micrococcales bacterium]|nr:alternate-type signal peptide domain-containing protein [Micrococcales bacterium]
MERLTKAAIATGGATVLLLGGIGTVAYWTDQGTATGGSLTSGQLSLTDGTCDPWQYDPSDGGGPVVQIVPGDIVVTSCEFTVEGEGDHLAVSAELDSTQFSDPANNLLEAALAPNVDSTFTLDGSPVPTTGVALTSGPHTLTVDVQVTFPYGDDTDPGNDTQNLTATLDDVVITVVQMDPMG